MYLHICVGDKQKKRLLIYIHRRKNFHFVILFFQAVTAFYNIFLFPSFGCDILTHARTCSTSVLNPEQIEFNVVDGTIKLYQFPRDIMSILHKFTCNLKYPRIFYLRFLSFLPSFYKWRNKHALTHNRTHTEEFTVTRLDYF